MGLRGALGLALWTAAAVPAPVASQADLSPAERHAVEALLGEARVLTFGESAHGLVEAHDFASALFRTLVEEHGFRVLFLESSWYLDRALERFMACDAESVPQEAAFYLNAFNSPQVVELLRWVRDWNGRHPDDPVRVTGMQPESPVSDARAIRAFAEAAGGRLSSSGREAAASIWAALGGFENDVTLVVQANTRQPSDPLSDEVRERVLRETHRLRRVLHQTPGGFPNVPPDVERRARLATLSLATYLGGMLPFARAFAAPEPPANMEELRRAGYQEGDRTRVRIVRTLLDTEYRGLRAMTWMHNWHAALQSREMGMDHPAVPPRGTTSFGTRLEEELGPDHVVMGSVTRPPEDWTAREDDHELGRLLAEELGPRRSVLPLRGPGAPAAAASPGTLLMDPRFGIVAEDVVLARHFDGVVYFPAWTPRR